MVEYNFSKEKVTDEVKVVVDKSLIHRGPKKTEEEIAQEKKEYFSEKRNLIGRNTQTKLGNESAMGKDDRLFKLKAAFDAQKVVTVTSAVTYMGLSRATIIKYAKEINISLFDDEKKVWL